MKRIKELKYEGNTLDQEFKIREILLHHKLDWFMDVEINQARIEIINDTLVWNAGVWYNGTWKYGVFRSGEWRYGTWEDGVWYNGLWRNGIFNNGIIFNGKFLNGEIIKGDLRGGEFVDIKISDETKVSQEVKIFQREQKIFNFQKFKEIN